VPFVTSIYCASWTNRGTGNREAARNPSSDVSTGPAEGEAQAEAAAARGEPQPAVHRAALKSTIPRLGREFDATAARHT